MYALLITVCKCVHIIRGSNKPMVIISEAIYLVELNYESKTFTDRYNLHYKMCLYNLSSKCNF